jgi:predicted SnoaL-like aldol condensation-catalyzing enzyme
VSDLEQNKQLVLDFFELAFNQKRVDEAVERYIGPTYTQHNPEVADGREGLLAFAKQIAAQFPALELECKRVIAEGDLVAVHVHGRQRPGDRGIVSMDIFRVENGRLAEHWDVSQEIPEKSANDNGMF